MANPFGDDVNEAVRAAQQLVGRLDESATRVQEVVTEAKRTGASLRIPAPREPVATPRVKAQTDDYAGLNRAVEANERLLRRVRDLKAEIGRLPSGREAQPEETLTRGRLERELRAVQATRKQTGAQVTVQRDLVAQRFDEGDNESRVRRAKEIHQQAVREVRERLDEEARLERQGAETVRQIEETTTGVVEKEAGKRRAAKTAPVPEEPQGRRRITATFRDRGEEIVKTRESERPYAFASRDEGGQVRFHETEAAAKRAAGRYGQIVSTDLPREIERGASAVQGAVQKWVAVTREGVGHIVEAANPPQALKAAREQGIETTRVVSEKVATRENIEVRPIPTADEGDAVEKGEARKTEATRKGADDRQKIVEEAGARRVRTEAEIERLLSPNRAEEIRKATPLNRVQEGILQDVAARNVDFAAQPPTAKQQPHVDRLLEHRLIEPKEGGGYQATAEGLARQSFRLDALEGTEKAAKAAAHQQRGGDLPIFRANRLVEDLQRLGREFEALPEDQRGPALERITEAGRQYADAIKEHERRIVTREATDAERYEGRVREFTNRFDQRLFGGVHSDTLAFDEAAQRFAQDRGGRVRPFRREIGPRPEERQPEPPIYERPSRFKDEAALQRAAREEQNRLAAAEDATRERLRHLTRRDQGPVKESLERERAVRQERIEELQAEVRRRRGTATPEDHALLQRLSPEPPRPRAITPNPNQYEQPIGPSAERFFSEQRQRLGDISKAAQQERQVRLAELNKTEGAVKAAYTRLRNLRGDRYGSIRPFGENEGPQRESIERAEAKRDTARSAYDESIEKANQAAEAEKNFRQRIRERRTLQQEASQAPRAEPDTSQETTKVVERTERTREDITRRGIEERETLREHEATTQQTRDRATEHATETDRTQERTVETDTPQTQRLRRAVEENEAALHTLREQRAKLKEIQGGRDATALPPEERQPIFTQQRRVEDAQRAQRAAQERVRDSRLLLASADVPQGQHETRTRPERLEATRETYERIREEVRSQQRESTTDTSSSKERVESERTAERDRTQIAESEERSRTEIARESSDTRREISERDVERERQSSTSASTTDRDRERTTDRTAERTTAERVTERRVDPRDVGDLKDAREHIPFMEEQVQKARAARDEHITRTTEVYGDRATGWPASAEHSVSSLEREVTNLEQSLETTRQVERELSQRVEDQTTTTRTAERESTTSDRSTTTDRSASDRERASTTETTRSREDIQRDIERQRETLERRRAAGEVTQPARTTQGREILRLQQELAEFDRRTSSTTERTTDRDRTATSTADRTSEVSRTREDVQRDIERQRSELERRQQTETITRPDRTTQGREITRLEQELRDIDHRQSSTTERTQTESTTRERDTHTATSEAERTSTVKAEEEKRTEATRESSADRQQITEREAETSRREVTDRDRTTDRTTTDRQTSAATTTSETDRQRTLERERQRTTIERGSPATRVPAVRPVTPEGIQALQGYINEQQRLDALAYKKLSQEILQSPQTLAALQRATPPGYDVEKVIRRQAAVDVEDSPGLPQKELRRAVQEVLPGFTATPPTVGARLETPPRAPRLEDDSVASRRTLEEIRQHGTFTDYQEELRRLEQSEREQTQITRTEEDKRTEATRTASDDRQRVTERESKTSERSSTSEQATSTTDRTTSSDRETERRSTTQRLSEQTRDQARELVRLRQESSASSTRIGERYAVQPHGERPDRFVVRDTETGERAAGTGVFRSREAAQTRRAEIVTAAQTVDPAAYSYVSAFRNASDAVRRAADQIEAEARQAPSERQQARLTQEPAQPAPAPQAPRQAPPAPVSERSTQEVVDRTATTERDRTQIVDRAETDRTEITQRESDRRREISEAESVQRESADRDRSSTTERTSDRSSDRSTDRTTDRTTATDSTSESATDRTRTTEREEQSRTEIAREASTDRERIAERERSSEVQSARERLTEITRESERLTQTLQQRVERGEVTRPERTRESRQIAQLAEERTQIIERRPEAARPAEAEPLAARTIRTREDILSDIRRQQQILDLRTDLKRPERSVPGRELTRYQRELEEHDRRETTTSSAERTTDRATDHTATSEADRTRILEREEAARTEITQQSSDDRQRISEHEAQTRERSEVERDRSQSTDRTTDRATEKTTDRATDRTSDRTATRDSEVSRTRQDILRDLQTQRTTLEQRTGITRPERTTQGREISRLERELAEFDRRSEVTRSAEQTSTDRSTSSTTTSADRTTEIERQREAERTQVVDQAERERTEVTRQASEDRQRLVERDAEAERTTVERESQDRLRERERTSTSTSTTSDRSREQIVSREESAPRRAARLAAIEAGIPEQYAHQWEPLPPGRELTHLTTTRNAEAIQREGFEPRDPAPRQWAGLRGTFFSDPSDPLHAGNFRSVLAKVTAAGEQAVELVARPLGRLFRSTDPARSNQVVSVDPVPPSAITSTRRVEDVSTLEERRVEEEKRQASDSATDRTRTTEREETQRTETAREAATDRERLAETERSSEVQSARERVSEIDRQSERLTQTLQRRVEGGEITHPERTREARQISRLQEERAALQERHPELAQRVAPPPTAAAPPPPPPPPPRPTAAAPQEPEPPRRRSTYTPVDRPFTYPVDAPERQRRLEVLRSQASLGDSARALTARFEETAEASTRARLPTRAAAQADIAFGREVWQRPLGVTDQPPEYRLRRPERLSRAAAAADIAGIQSPREFVPIRERFTGTGDALARRIAPGVERVATAATALESATATLRVAGIGQVERAAGPSQAQQAEVLSRRIAQTQAARIPTQDLREAYPSVASEAQRVRGSFRSLAEGSQALADRIAGAQRPQPAPLRGRTPYTPIPERPPQVPPPPPPATTDEQRLAEIQRRRQEAVEDLRQRRSDSIESERLRPHRQRLLTGIKTVFSQAPELLAEQEQDYAAEQARRSPIRDAYRRHVVGQPPDQRTVKTPERVAYEESARGALDLAKAERELRESIEERQRQQAQAPVSSTAGAGGPPPVAAAGAGGGGRLPPVVPPAPPTPPTPPPSGPDDPRYLRRLGGGVNLGSQTEAAQHFAAISQSADEAAVRLGAYEEAVRAAMAIDEDHAAALHRDRVEATRSATAYGAVTQEYRKHGAATTEFLSSLGKGTASVKEIGFQALATAGKFGAWTAASFGVFGVLGAVSSAGKGAIQSMSGVNQLQRFIGNLDTQKAQRQFRDLSREFNLPISDVTEAFANMGRVFNTQDQAFEGARSTLLAVRVGELNVADATRYLTAIYQGFHVPASQTATVIDQINQAQNTLNFSIKDGASGIARAAGNWRAAGGTFSDLLAIMATAQRSTGATGDVVGTALRRSAGFIGKPTNQAALRGFGIDPTAGIDQVYEQAFSKVESGQVAGQDITRLATALSSPQLAAVIGPTLQNFDLYRKALRQTNEEASRGSAQRELAILLDSVGEKVHRIATDLEQLGSNLAQSGMLSGLGLMLETVNSSLVAVNNLFEAFNRLPAPIRTALSTAVQFYGALRLARRLNIGDALAESGGRVSGPVGRFIQGNPARSEFKQLTVGLDKEQKDLSVSRERIGRQYYESGRQVDVAKENVARIRPEQFVAPGRSPFEARQRYLAAVSEAERQVVIARAQRAALQVELDLTNERIRDTKLRNAAIKDVRRQYGPTAALTEASGGARIGGTNYPVAGYVPGFDRPTERGVQPLPYQRGAVSPGAAFVPTSAPPPRPIPQRESAFFQRGQIAPGAAVTAPSLAVLGTQIEAEAERARRLAALEGTRMGGAKAAIGRAGGAIKALGVGLFSTIGGLGGLAFLGLAFLPDIISKIQESRRKTRERLRRLSQPVTQQDFQRSVEAAAEDDTARARTGYERPYRPPRRQSDPVTPGERRPEPDRPVRLPRAFGRIGAQYRNPTQISLEERINVTTLRRQQEIQTAQEIARRQATAPQPLTSLPPARARARTVIPYQFLGQIQAQANLDISNLGQGRKAAQKAGEIYDHYVAAIKQSFEGTFGAKTKDKAGVTGAQRAKEAIDQLRVSLADATNPRTLVEGLRSSSLGTVATQLEQNAQVVDSFGAGRSRLGFAGRAFVIAARKVGRRRDDQALKDYQRAQQALDQTLQANVDATTRELQRATTVGGATRVISRGLSSIGGEIRGIRSERNTARRSLRVWEGVQRRRRRTLDALNDDIRNDPLSRGLDQFNQSNALGTPSLGGAGQGPLARRGRATSALEEANRKVRELRAKVRAGDRAAAKKIGDAEQARVDLLNAYIQGTNDLIDANLRVANAKTSDPVTQARNAADAARRKRENLKGLIRRGDVTRKEAAPALQNSYADQLEADRDRRDAQQQAAEDARQKAQDARDERKRKAQEARDRRERAAERRRQAIEDHLNLMEQRSELYVLHLPESQRGAATLNALRDRLAYARTNRVNQETILGLQISIAQQENDNAEEAKQKAKEALDKQRETIESIFNLRRSLTDDPNRLATLDVRRDRRLTRVGGTANERRDAQARLNEDIRNRAVTRHDQEIEDAQTLHDIGKIGDAALERIYRRAIRDRHVGVDQRRKWKNDLLRLQHDLDKESDFPTLTIGDIRLPTVYDIRRFAAQGTRGASQTSVNNQATVNVTINDRAGGEEFGRQLSGIFPTTAADMRSAGLRG